VSLGAARRVAPAPGVGALFTVVGCDEIAAFDRDLDALTVRCGAPVTARWAWIWPALREAGAACSATMVVGVDGSLAAAALLVYDVDQDGGRRITLASGGDGHRASFLAVDDDAATALAEAVAGMLSSTTPGARLRLGPLPANDPCLALLLGLLPGTATVSDDVVPLVRRNGSADVDSYLSHGMSRTLRKSRNRLDADGLTWSVQTTTDTETIVAALPEIEAVSRQRDHAGGRVSLLDDEAGQRRWTSRLAALAAVAHLELSTLHIDGVPAAYVLGVVEHGCYRVIEGRFAIEWKRYSPGRLLEADVLQRVLTSDEVATLDWMTSVAPESLLSANAAERLVVVDVVF